MQILGLEILTWLDARDRDERERLQIASSLAAAGAGLYQAAPGQPPSPEGVVEGEAAIEDPEVALDLSGVEWEVPTEEELAEIQRQLAEMASQQDGGDGGREWV